MQKTDYRLIGVMSGTSLDGVDIVFTEISFSENVKYEIKASATISYTSSWKQKLSEAIYLNPEALSELDKEFTAYLAKLIKEFIKTNDIDLLDAICSHGHTVKHRPDKGYTVQIGNRPELAKLTGVQVVCDFRVQDVELGGQGAPLVPIGDRLLFSEYKYCINLGGFANISTEEDSKRIAYDICPVNTVFNHLMEEFDKDFDEDGKVAKSGEIDHTLLKKLNSLSFYNLKPPKSLGIEWVKKEIFPLLKTFEIPVRDKLRTFTEHVVVQISKCLDNNKNSAVLMTGGGTFNTFLIEQLRAKSHCEFVLPKKELIDFKEALIFALLGALKLKGDVNVLHSVTGAKMDHSSGRIFHP